jgi:hypothetical protein
VPGPLGPGVETGVWIPGSEGGGRTRALGHTQGMGPKKFNVSLSPTPPVLTNLSAPPSSFPQPIPHLASLTFNPFTLPPPCPPPSLLLPSPGLRSPIVPAPGGWVSVLPLVPASQLHGGGSQAALLREEPASLSGCALYWDPKPVETSAHFPDGDTEPWSSAGLAGCRKSENDPLLPGP